MEKKYKLGVVFSGGGTKAAAHCGAVQALMEFGIEPDVLAGTSAGSLVAAYYSAGFKPEQMIQMFDGMSFFRDIVTPKKPAGGLFSSTPLVKFIRKTMPYKNIEDLPIPIYVAASDLDNGKTTIFTEGEIAPRLVASSSIPVIIQPMVIDGIHYVDGGVFMNLPIPAIRENCEKVIAISVRQMAPEKYKDNVVPVALRAYEMMFNANMIEDRRLADYCIELDTSKYSTYDVSNLKKLYRLGYEQASAQLLQMGFSRVSGK